MKSIFIVNSPLQLLNASEARAYFKIDNCILIIKGSNNKIHNAQINKILEIWKWDNIVRLPLIKGLSYFRDIIYLKYLTLKKERYEYLFFGDYSPITLRIYAINLMADNVILLDDGLVTITITKQYLSENNYIDYVYSPIGDKIRKIIANTLFLKTKFRNKIDLFSCYNVNTHKGQNLFVNKYDLVNKIFEKEEYAIDKTNIYFIGAQYVEMGIICIENYIKIFEKLIETYPDKRIIYVPHRFENEEKLNKLAKLNIEVRHFDNIFELEFIFMKIYPVNILGFLSSAMVTMQCIYKQANIININLNEKYIEPKFKETFANLQESYTLENNIKSILIE
ncbi:MAG: hypothetical protein A2X12_09785 [Bacteroidetes bacterium GWE2_29_8]|nr:MAG: hypothetical protein A2X12_09785 [Bacteroidetes bacterium GWE2_29_8]OFY16609.1 MAG: hypothetical protein A2X02_05580 [Bacteroidetes bacterium GWF2_29_10]